MDEADPTCIEHLRQGRAEAEQQYGNLGLDGLAWQTRVCRCLRRRLGTGAPTQIALEAAWTRTARADLVLASACAAGSDVACGVLNEAQRPRLLAYCRMRLPAANPEAFVDDLLGYIHTPAPTEPDETVLGTYHGGGSLYAWLRILAYRRAVDRKERADRERVDEYLSVRAAPQEDQSTRVADEALDTALSRLFERAPDEHLCLLWCRVVYGMSARLLSQLLRVTESTLSKTQGRFKALTQTLMRDVDAELTRPRLAQIAERVRAWGDRQPPSDPEILEQLTGIEQALRALPADDLRILDLRVRHRATVQVVGPLFGLERSEVHARTHAAIRRAHEAAGLPGTEDICAAQGPRGRRLLDGFVHLLARLAPVGD